MLWGSCAALLVFSPPSGFSQRGLILWRAAILATFWGLWLERNSRIFEDQGENENIVWDKMKYWVRLWVYGDKELGKPSFSDFFRTCGTSVLILILYPHV